MHVEAVYIKNPCMTVESQHKRVISVELWYKDINGEFNDFKGGHAGLTEEEMTVPLIVIEKK